MKNVKRICALLLAALLAVAVFPVAAGAEEPVYEKTDAYALNWNGGYGPYCFEYSSMYNPLLTYTWANEDSYLERTGVNPLYNKDDPSQYISVYCVDEYTGLRTNDYRRLNLEESSYFEPAAAAQLRSIVLNGFPKASAEALGQAAGVENLTIGEAVHATQLAIWKASYGDEMAILDFAYQIDPKQWFTRNKTIYYEESYAEVASGYASEENLDVIGSRTETVFNYLMGLAATPARSVAVSNASFTAWDSPVLTDNGDGTCDVSVTATVNVSMGEEDSLMLTAVMANDSTRFVSVPLSGGISTHTLTIENVPAAQAKGNVTLAIDGTQTAEDVYMYVVDGDRAEGQALIGYSDMQLPVHAEVTAEPARILKIYKTTVVQDAQDSYTRVPLEGITFDLYAAAGLSEYVSGKVELSEPEVFVAAVTAENRYPTYTIVTDENGMAELNLTKAGLPDGVYLMVERRHAAISQPTSPFYIMLPYTNESGTGWKYELLVQPKNDIKGEVKIEKDVIKVGKDEASVDAYQSHAWIIRTTIPVDIAEGKKFIVSDTLDNRLDFVGNMKVQVEHITDEAVEPVALEETEDYILTVTDSDALAEGKPSDAFMLELTAEGMKKVGAAVGEACDDYMLRIYFDAQINANAAMGQEIPNQATLDYTNSVGFDFKAESDIPKVYTGAIELVKVDSQVQTETLEGAVFQVYRPATIDEIADETLEKVTIDDMQTPMVQVSFFDNAELLGEKVQAVTSDAEGKVRIYGLAYGTYYLVETKAPAGYNLLDKSVELTIHEVSHLEESTVKVLNSSGTVLPETGGVGATVFIVPGIILMAASVFVLFLRKREIS